MMNLWENYSQGANPFISASRILEVTASAGNQQLKNERGKQFWIQTMIPAIVMKAFSCELMLKALIAYEKEETIRGHKLNELFHQLSSTLQASLYSKIVSRLRTGNPNYSLIEFEKDLNDAADLFVDWRYFFETAVGSEKTVNLTFLDILFNELESQKKLLS